MLMNNKGLSLVFAIVILLIFAVLVAVLTSVVSTDADIAFHEFRSNEAQYIADGGIEYIFANRTFPDYSMIGATVNLGGGSFTVDTPAYTTVVVPGPGVPDVTITVNSTNWFETNPAPGLGTVGLIINGEEIECTAVNPATQFTTCNSFSGGPVTGGQPVDTEVYPVTHLNIGAPLLPGACPITVISTRGFVPIGTISIDNEIIYYTGTTATTFTGCTRGYKGTTDVAHPDGRSVYQYVISSTGTVPTGIIGNAQRVVRVTAGIIN
jgi:hypothetical protein